MSGVREDSFYELLEVSTNATLEEIERSYQRIVAYLDANSLAIYSMMEDDEALQMRSAVDQAFRVLSDGNRRSAYDRALAGGEETYPPVVVPDVSSDSNMSVGHVGTFGMVKTSHATGDPSSTESNNLLTGEFTASLSQSQPSSSQPSSSQPSSSQPASSQPSSSQPSSSQPSSSQPASSQPASSQPSSSQPASSQPASSQPASSQPASSQPASSQSFSISDASVPGPMQSDAHGDFGARESESLRSSADQMGRNLEKSRLVPTPRPHKPLATRKVRRLQPSLDIQLSDDTEFSGSLLRRLRESADATVQDVADITKIGKRYVHAIEENDFSSLPAAVYVRGFVAEYARALGIDPLMVARSYMALYARYKNGGGEGK